MFRSPGSKLRKTRPINFEELEPRLLFSADLPVLPPAFAEASIGDGYVQSQQIGLSTESTDSVSSDHSRQEIVFVDPNTPDYESLMEGIQTGDGSDRQIEIVLLDPGRDGLMQIGEVLSYRQGIDAIHIISHGRDGALALGASEFNLDRLLASAGEVAEWRSALTDDADVLIYGCDLAAGAEGHNLIATLAALTGADVAASDDPTGFAAMGGDWSLEYQLGSVETRSIGNEDLIKNWQATLAVGATNLNAAQSYVEDTPLDLTDILVSGSASGTTTVTLTLSDTNAGMLSTGTSGAATSTFSNGVWTAAGSQTDVNALLAGVLFTPSPDYASDFSIATSVDDGVDPPVTGIKVMTAVPVNDPPVAVDDSYVVDEDGSLTAVLGVNDLLLNDFDVEGDPLTVNAVPVNGPSNGALSLNADGTFTYTPNANFNGFDSFTYEIDDGNGNSDQSNATIWVRPVNDAPILDTSIPLAFTAMYENEFMGAGESSGDVLANSPGDAITDIDFFATEGLAVIGVDDSNGTWQHSINNGNSWQDFGAISETNAVLLSGNSKLIRFVPDASFTGSTSITIRAWDSTSGGNGATGVDTTVNGGETSFSTDTQTVTLDVLRRSSSIYISTDGNVNNSGQALKSWSNGSIIGIGDPDIQFEPGTSAGTYSLKSDLDLFAADSEVQLTAQHFVTGNITIGDSNTVTLQAGDILFATSASETLSSTNSLSFNAGDIIAFRPDIPGNYSSGSFFHIIDNPGTSTSSGITLVDQPVLVGDILLTPGSFLFTQAGSGGDQIYHFSVDSAGAGTTTGTVSTLIDFAALAAGFSGELSGVHLVTAQMNVGSTTLQTGSIVVGTTATSAFTVGDTNTGVTRNDLILLSPATTNMGSGSSSATATILFEGADLGLTADREQIRSISLINHAQEVIAGGELYDLIEDQTFTATLGVDDLLLNDSDRTGDPLAVNTTPVIGPANGILVLNADGTFTYTPDAEFSGIDGFTYEVADGNGNFAQATATLAVAPVNDPPVAVDDSYAVDEDGSLTAVLGVNDLLGNDGDLDGDSLSVVTSPVSGPANGTLTLNADGTFTYTPDANFTGSDSFVYQVSDGNGGTAQATASITVNAVNDPPVAGNAPASWNVSENNSAVGTISVIDPDGDRLTFSLTGGPEGSLFSIDPATGTLRFNLPPDFEAPADSNADNVYEALVTATDTAGATFEQQVNVTVVDTNEAPLLADQVITLAQSMNPGDVVGQATALDQDAGDSITYAITGGPSAPQFVIDETTGLITASSAITPDVQSQTVSLTVEVTDSAGASTTARVTIAIQPIADGESGSIPVDPVIPVPVTESIGIEPAQTPVTQETVSGNLEGQPSGTTEDPQIKSELQPQAKPIESLDPEARQYKNPPVLFDMPYGTGTPPDGHASDPASSNGPSASTVHRGFQAIFNILFESDKQDELNEESAAEELALEGLRFEMQLDGLLPNAFKTFTLGSEESGDVANNPKDSIVSAATATGLSLSVGVVAWAMRTGALLSGVFAARPIWQGFDPLPVLRRNDEDEDEKPDSAGQASRLPDTDLLGERFDR